MWIIITVRNCLINQGKCICKICNFSPFVCQLQIIQVKIDNTGFSDVLHLKVGSRVMLMYNVEVNDGLSNGQLETVSEFLAEKQDDMNCIFIKSVHETISKKFCRQCPRLSCFSLELFFSTSVKYISLTENVGADSCRAARSRLPRFPNILALASTCRSTRPSSFSWTENCL